jgi:endogenous inhibitor of DNA gyrase (YacG/DUF329 family)
MHLRPYQTDAIAATVVAWSDHADVLGVAATGAGKTVLPFGSRFNRFPQQDQDFSIQRTGILLSERNELGVNFFGNADRDFLFHNHSYDATNCRHNTTIAPLTLIDNAPICRYNNGVVAAYQEAFMSWFRKPNRTCEMCGKGFYTPPSRVAIGHGRFCSKACMGRERDRRVEIACETCGTRFLINAYEVGRQRFCSPSCGMRSRSGERGPRWKGGEVEVKCGWCGKPYMVRRYRAEETTFCSHRCKGDWMTATNVREHHPNWRGGFSRADYPRTFNERFKEMIRERDNRCCALCGKPGKEVHHIDYVKANTTPENCITLCPSCHSRTNANRDRWAVALRIVMRERGY